MIATPSIFAYAQREQGSRDLRMLPVAAIMWGSCLLAHLATPVAVWIAVGLVALLLMVFVAFTLAGRMHGRIRSCRNRDKRNRGTAVRDFARYCTLAGLTIMIGAMLVGVSVTIVHDMRRQYDAATLQAHNNAGYAIVTASIRTPVTASDNRQRDCQADAVLHTVSEGLTVSPSHESIRIYADGDDCSTIEYGAVQTITGRLQPADYGSEPLWLIAYPETGIHTVKAANSLRRMVTAAQESFFAVSQRLPEQGRVLVPGLTLGILGQDHVTITQEGERAQPINDTYAGLLENRFRRSGIMHLMAVSGGHFVLVIAGIRRLCAHVLLPRHLTAICMAAGAIVLSVGMYPADSVHRALVSSLFGAACLWLGRRQQICSTLSWTIIGTLILEPDMAYSYGFALSCAAVFGIMFFAEPIAQRLETVTPSTVAQAAGMTVAAQTTTLPIQVLMEPELPVLSVPANLLVSPFVGFATICGLGALAVSWLNADIGYALARIASLGTAVMEYCANMLGSDGHAVLPWPDGWRGAVIMVLTEAGIWFICRMIGKWLHATARRRTVHLFDENAAGNRDATHTAQHGRTEEDADDAVGEAWVDAPMTGVRQWWKYTMRWLHDMDWACPPIRRN